MHELSTTSTYESFDESDEDIVKRHVQFCNIYTIPVEDLCLPFVHMVPKFHKENLDFRYIAARIKSSAIKLYYHNFLLAFSRLQILR